MRRNALPLAVLLAAGLAASACEDATEGQEIFTTTLSGANEVPVRSTGASGVNGPVRVTFFTGSPLSTSEKHILADGTFTASDVSGISFADLLAAIRTSNTYMNVHTTA